MIKSLTLIILDGWGINQSYNGNAITEAKTPNVDKLISKYPAMTLQASGPAVGLPWGKYGNSEVGHANIGLGRIIYQDLTYINKAINNQKFFKNKALLNTIEHTKKNKSCLHLIGLVSNGGVHSSFDHLLALINLIKRKRIKNAFLHVILDGRDSIKDQGIEFIKKIIKHNNIIKIATISGRFYAMDRNNNWDRTAKAYEVMVQGKGKKSINPLKALEKSYKNKIYDEEFIPTVIQEGGQPVGKITNDDGVIFFYFRPDRARQLTKAFVIKKFTGPDAISALTFKRAKLLKNLFFTTFTQYEKNLPVKVAFYEDSIKNSLGEILAKNGLKQFRIAETEKYAHVTYFFNGGKEKKFENEDNFLIPSPLIESYDLKPEMSAHEITKKTLEILNENIYNFILLNFANSDMVGHTGNIQSAIKATETVDYCVGKIIKKILKNKGIALITSDHGNADVMFDLQTGRINKEHTSNPVPFIIVSQDLEGKSFEWKNLAGNDLSMIQPQGVLSDIAPTILKLLNIEKPKEMTGTSLI